MSPTVDPKYQGTHFSEIIAERLNFKLVSYAMPGMSVGGICIQLKTVLELKPKPDLILLNITSSTRFEWPINEVQKIDNLSVYDLCYPRLESLGSRNEGINVNPKLISHSIDFVLEKKIKFFEKDLAAFAEFDKYGKERFEALAQYITWLYHPNFKEFQDSCMVYAMIHKLHLLNIPYIILMDDHSSVECKSFPWITSKNYASDDVRKLNYGHKSPNWVDPGYHTTPKCQLEIANLLIKDYIPFLV